MSGLDHRGIAETKFAGCVGDDDNGCVDVKLRLQVSVADLDDPTIVIGLDVENGNYILFAWSTFAAALRECDWMVLAHGAAGDPER